MGTDEDDDYTWAQQSVFRKASKFCVMNDFLRSTKILEQIANNKQQSHRSRMSRKAQAKHRSKEHIIFLIDNLPVQSIELFYFSVCPISMVVPSSSRLFRNSFEKMSMCTPHKNPWTVQTIVVSVCYIQYSHIASLALPVTYIALYFRILDAEAVSWRWGRVSNLGCFCEDHDFNFGKCLRAKVEEGALFD